MADLRHLLAIYVHAHQTGNSVPPHIDTEARAALAAEPTFIASEPSDEDLEDLAEVFNGDPLPAMRRALELWGRPTVATLAAEPSAPAPAADGEREEREELATFLKKEAVAMDYWFERDTAKKVRRAAALLREARPQPVPVAERPWKRLGWRDAEGRCWWFNRFGIPEWQLADGGPYGDFCLPHWAIPQPPQGGEVGS